MRNIVLYSVYNFGKEFTMSLFGNEKSSVSSCLVTLVMGTMPLAKDLYQVHYLVKIVILLSHRQLILNF